MPTSEDIRRCALALPETCEAPHFEKASFRVGKKIFCTLEPNSAVFVLRLDPEDQLNLVDGEAVRPVEGAWGHKGWTRIDGGRIAFGRLSDLMRLAWAGVAPKRLLRPA